MEFTIQLVFQLLMVLLFGLQIVVTKRVFNPSFKFNLRGTLSVDIRLTELSEETGSGCNSPSENVFIQYNDALNNWYNLTSSFSPDPTLPHNGDLQVFPYLRQPMGGVQFRVIQTIPGLLQIHQISLAFYNKEITGE